MEGDRATSMSQLKKYDLVIMERWRQRWQVSQIPERGRKIERYAGPSFSSQSSSHTWQGVHHPSFLCHLARACQRPPWPALIWGWLVIGVIHLMGWLFQSSAQYPKTCIYPSRRFSLIVVMIELTEISRKLEKLCLVTFHFLSNGNWIQSFPPHYQLGNFFQQILLNFLTPSLPRPWRWWSKWQRTQFKSPVVA